MTPIAPDNVFGIDKVPEWAERPLEKWVRMNWPTNITEAKLTPTLLVVVCRMLRVREETLIERLHFSVERLRP